MKNKIGKIITVLLLIFLITGCSGGSKNRNTKTSSQVVDVRMGLKIPRYDSNSLKAQIIDPQTFEVTVRVTASDMAEIVQSFNINNNLYQSDEGYYYMDCTIQNVPVGLQRLFYISARDSLGRTLTEGTTTINIDFNVQNEFEIGLLPCDFVEITSLGSNIGSVEYGKAKYYKIDFNAFPDNLFEVSLQSLNATKLQLYEGDGTGEHSVLPWDWGSPKGQTVKIEKSSYDPEYNIYYFQVIGEQAGLESNYTINVNRVSGTPFGSDFIMEKFSSGYTSIETTGTLVTIDYDLEFGVIPIGFTFVYHGKEFDKVFISNENAIAFEPYGINYIYDCLGDSKLPNELILLADSASGCDSIFYQLQGSAPNRKLVVEFKYSPSDSGSIYLNGQIVLYEGSNTIELIYDREHSALGFNYSLGCENEDGSDFRGETNISGVPAQNYRFRYSDL